MSSSRETKTKKSTSVKEKGQLSNNFYTIITVIMVVALVFALGLTIFQNVLNSGNFTAAEIGEEKVMKHEVNFYYMSSYMNFVNTYGEYLPYFGLDTSLSLKKQAYSEEQTWHDYFLDGALSSIRESKMHANEAKKAGVSLSDENQKRVQDDIAALEKDLAANEYDMERYLKSYYGKLMTKEEYTRILSETYLAQQYSGELYNSYIFTDEDIKNYYSENTKDFDVVDFRSFSFPVAPTMEDPSEADTAAAKSAAKSLADIMANSITDEDSFAKLSMQNAPEESKEAYEDPAYTLSTGVNFSGLSSNPTLADWLYDNNRTGGDITVIETDTSCMVVYMGSRYRNDYNTVNVRHILIPFEMDEGAETPTPAQKESAKDEIAIINSEWEKSATTEESFAALAKERSQDPGSIENGGLYEGIYKNQMVPAFNDWIFDSARKPGDTGIVETEYGYHLIYFVSEGVPYWTVEVEAAMRGTEYTDYTKALLESSYPVKRHKLGLASVGLPG